MVVTPHNPHKKKSSLLDDYHRLTHGAFGGFRFSKNPNHTDIEIQINHNPITPLTL